MPYLQHTPLYFLGYLIVNSIQMGANIDYAIVISSHYTDLKKVMRPKEAIVAALNESFPTIFTSGSILASAGILISVLTTNPVIAAIGTCLGRGTIVSIILVLFVLPQILILGDTIIERTSFEMKGVSGMTRTASGTMHVNGRVRGYINGVVDADIKGVLHGQFSANIATGTEFEVDKPDMYLAEGNIHESEKISGETPDSGAKGRRRRMSRISDMMRRLWAALLALCLVLALTLPVFAEGGGTDTAEEKETCHIGTVEELLQLADYCRLDSWSENRTVVLDTDLELTGSGFIGIPSFSGVFEGQGHTVSGLSLVGDGSVVGFFRYVQKDANVRDLVIRGRAMPTGSRSTVGGVAGSNAGTLHNCRFEGRFLRRVRGGRHCRYKPCLRRD